MVNTFEMHRVVLAGLAAMVKAAADADVADKADARIAAGIPVLYDFMEHYITMGEAAAARGGDEDAQRAEAEHISAAMVRWSREQGLDRCTGLGTSARFLGLMLDTIADYAASAIARHAMIRDLDAARGTCLDDPTLTAKLDAYAAWLDTAPIDGFSN